MTGSYLLFAALFGAVGLGYIVYAKKEQNGVALLSGVALCAFPYFVGNLLLLIVIGIVLLALPFVMRS